MEGYDEKLISSFKIVSEYSDRVEKRRGRLVSTDNTDIQNAPARLQHYGNPSGDFYEERHLEEWIAREPLSIFGDRKVLIVASQAYVYLQEKIDLLFVDQNCQFHIVELKIEPIGRHKLESQKLYGQMRRYVEYVKSQKIKYFNACYRRFAKRFYGRECELSEQLHTFLGRAVDGEARINPEVYVVYVGESFDEFAVTYLLRRAHEDKAKARLIYYKFYPQQQCIQFWEISHKPVQTA